MAASRSTRYRSSESAVSDTIISRKAIWGPAPSSCTAFMNRHCKSPGVTGMAPMTSDATPIPRIVKRTVRIPGTSIWDRAAGLRETTAMGCAPAMLRVVCRRSVNNAGA